MYITSPNFQPEPKDKIIGNSKYSCLTRGQIAVILVTGNENATTSNLLT